jgi:hypothetical protein
MCNYPSGIAAMILPGSKTTMTLENVLDLDNRVYHLGQAIQLCERCCSRLDCTVELLNALEKLAILYQAAHTRWYSCFITSSPEHKANCSYDIGTPAQQVLIKSSSIIFGCFELEEEESNIMSMTIIKCALSRLQVTTRAVHRRTLEKIEKIRVPLTAEDHRTMAKGADIDLKVEAILSRIWETIAHGKL